MFGIVALENISLKIEEETRMEFIIIDDHSSNNLTPLIIRKGERIKIGKKSTEADGWDNWIYCWSLTYGQLNSTY